MSTIDKDHWFSKRLQREPDIFHGVDSIVVTPVHHFMREIIICDLPTMNCLIGSWSVTSLWDMPPTEELADSIDKSTSVRQIVGAVELTWTESMRQDLFLDRVERTILPNLRSIDTMERLYAESMRHRERLLSDTPDARFRLELAMGNFEAATKILDVERDAWFRQPMDPWDKSAIRTLRKLCRMLESGNHAGIASAFHASEANFVKNYKSQLRWQETPFPFEPGYAAWQEAQRGHLG